MNCHKEENAIINISIMFLGPIASFVHKNKLELAVERSLSFQELMQQLEDFYPGIYKLITGNETVHKVQEGIVVLINGRAIGGENFEVIINAGDEVVFMTALAGG